MNATLEYEHHILNTSSPITGSKWMTKVYLFTPPNNRYYLGDDYGKLDDDQVKILFEETMKTADGRREYGQQVGGNRKLLQPIRDRGRVGSLSQQLSHKARPR